MQWGTNENFDLIKNAIQNEDYEPIYNLITSCAEPKVCSSIPIDGQLDVLHDIQLSVWTSLDEYVLNFENLNVEQRNTWFKKIVDCRKYDYWRTYYKVNYSNNSKKRKKAENKDNKVERKKLIVSLDEDYDNGNSLYDYGVVDNEIEKIIENSDLELTYKIIKFICNLSTSPDKILAFFYNKIISSYYAVTRNGKASKVAENLKGKSLNSIYWVMRKKINDVLDAKIDDAVFQGLVDKLYRYDGKIQYKDKVFLLSSRNITDSSNWIKMKLYEYLKEEKIFK